MNSEDMTQLLLQTMLTGLTLQSILPRYSEFEIELAQETAKEAGRLIFDDKLERTGEAVNTYAMEQFSGDERMATLVVGIFAYALAQTACEMEFGDDDDAS
jgi:hypothetical protein